MLCTGNGDAIIAHVAMPEGHPPPGGWPGVVLLHGSSGLFRKTDRGCSEEIHGRFKEWADTLNDQGYAVILPGSFYSRGFCTWSGRKDAEFDYDKEERLVVRAYDAAAAGDWLCAHHQVNCSRLAVFGFSNGASVAMLVMQEDLAVADDPRLRALRTPSFAGGVAYYPGCGLHGQLPINLDADQVHRYYYPKAPMWVPHAEKDRLAETCEQIRDPQVDIVAERRGVGVDMFELEVYDGAKHGFDRADDDDRKSDRRARAKARTRTLAKLAEWLGEGI